MDNINTLDKLGVNAEQSRSINVLLFVESRYRVNRKRIKEAVASVLSSQNISNPVEVSIGIIGDRKMRMLNKKYRGKEQTTNVLSFSLSEGDITVLPPVKNKSKEEYLRLGDIVISYPQVIREASAEEKYVDDKVDELVKHSMLHLLGIHHG